MTFRAAMKNNRRSVDDYFAFWMSRFQISARTLAIMSNFLRDSPQSLHADITNSMEQSPSWKCNMSSPSQQIPRILRNPKVHYGIHKHQLPVPVRNHIKPVHATPSHFLNLHFNIILPSMSRSSKWLFPSGLPTKTLYAPLISPLRATCPAHHIFSWFDHPNIIWSGVQIIKLLAM